MKSILRSLLVCFMLLALLFQGFAAAGMLPRVAVPGVPMAGHAAAGVALHAAVDEAAELPPCHRMAMQHAAPGEAAGEPGDHAGKPGAGQHGKCASCCIGAAMTPALAPGLPLAPPQFVSIPFRAGHLPSVDPSLLERPPRPRLA